MTAMTDEAVKALLDGATPGPWRADGEPWNRIVWSSADNRICFMSHSNGLNDERDVATSNLAAAAPDLARALLDARADTEAAVALTLEEADKHITAIEKLALSASIASCTCNIKTPDISFHSANCRYVKLEYIIAQCEDFRAFVPASGVAKLAELRAEIERLQGLVSASEAHRYRVCGELLAERDRLAAELDAAHDKYQRDVFGLNNEGDPIGGDPPSGLKQRADKAEAELAAANAREAGLRDFIGDFANAKIDALRYQPSYGESPEDEPDPVVDAETVWAWQADAKSALARPSTEVATNPSLCNKNGREGDQT